MTLASIYRTQKRPRRAAEELERAIRIATLGSYQQSLGKVFFAFDFDRHVAVLSTMLLLITARPQGENDVAHGCRAWLGGSISKYKISSRTVIVSMYKSS